MRLPRALSAAVGTAVLAGGLSGCGFHGLYSASLPGGADLGSHPYRVVVDFVNVLDLVPQSAVKVNDVTVGKVETIKLVDWHAEVQVVVNGDVRLPANAHADIRQTSLLGEKFVSLSFPPQPEVSEPTALADAPHQGFAHPHIGLARTGANADIEEVLGALSLLLNGGGLDQIKTITHELNEALKGHSDDIRGLLSQLSSFATTLNGQQAKILDAVDHLDTLARTLNTQKQVLATALDTMPQALAILADEKDQLVALLRSLDNLSTVAVKVVDESTDDVLTSLQNLDPVMTQLTKAGSDLAKATELLTTYPFPKTSVNGVRGDYTNLYADVDLNLSDLLSNLLTKPPAGAAGTPGTKSQSHVSIPGVGG
jgi:phospholipid/cholesterol/gamma-HCH transport system substrate-binding protein